MTIVGGGQLTVGTANAYMDIQGGNVTATTLITAETTVESAGLLTVTGQCTDPRYLDCDGTGSAINAQGGMTDVSLTVSGGAHVTAASIYNLLGSSCVFEGGGSMVSVSGGFYLAEGATLALSTGASMIVKGNLDMDGGTNISDGGASWTDPQTTTQVNGTFTVGDAKGSFFVALANGAQLTTGSAEIGSSGAKGYVTLSDTNTIWTVQDIGLVVGQGSPGSLTINAGATLAISEGGALVVGLEASSSGALQMNGPGAFINASGAGTAIGYDQGSQGSAQIQNHALMVEGQDFYVGAGGLGTLTLSSSGQLQMMGATTLLDIGVLPTGNGTLDVSDGAALIAQGYTTVGDAGIGRLSVAAGGIVYTSGITLGGSSGAMGTASISSNNSYWIETNELIVGSDPGSTGTFNVMAQGNLQVTGNCYIGGSGNGIFNVRSGGIFTLGNSTNQFGIGRSAGGAGYLTVADPGSVMNINSLCIVGVVGNGTAVVSNGASVYSSIAEIGSGSSSAGYLVIVGPGSTWVDGDSFIVGGGPGSGSGGNGVVYLSSQANLQVAGDCNIGGSGTANFYLNGGSSFTQIGSTRQFGVGYSSGSVGYLNVSDPNSVLNINSPCIIGVLGTGVAVVSNGASVHSSVAEVGSGTGSSGSLTITGPGSSWVARGNFFLGGATSSTSGGTANVYLLNGGTLRAGPLFHLATTAVVTIDSASQAAVGTGPFGAPGTMRVTPGGKLFGKGRVQGQIVIAPGGKYLPGDSPGVFTVDGNLTVQTGGEVDIFVGGITAGSNYSQINVTGTAMIGGTLNIILTNGYAPPPGQTFTILNAGAVSGNFDQVNGASITYGASGVTLSNVTGTTGIPQLSIETQGQNVVVSWPDTVQGYTLQTTSELSSTNLWSVVAPEENVYVAPITGVPAFFRLIK
jgi:T5SS/PEP-CTERM-associated repeat protein